MKRLAGARPIDLRVVSTAGFGEACFRALIDCAKGLERPAVGLATGATPVALYEAIRPAAATGTVDVSGWRPFAIDEYVCRRDHPCANRAFFARHWDAIPGAGPVSQFDPEAHDLEAEAARFSKVLRAAGGLDIAVLGIGTNGHLAFNEPGSARDSLARVATLTRESRLSASRCFAGPPALGLTLGLAELLGARRVLLLANGTGKAAIVARALEWGVNTDCPASFIREHESATVVLDEEAAARLSR
jgi:glucosamine-6-phosphate deaminase